MLQHFNKHEEFYKDLGSQYPELDLVNQWDFVKEYIAAFEPIYIATKSMQAMHTSLCDFYLTWIKAVMQVGKITSNKFAEPLATSLTRRLKQLKDNMVFKSALLIDPRFNYLNSTILCADEKEEVRAFIVATWERIKRLKACDSEQATQSTSAPTTLPCNDLDAFLTNMFGGSLPEQGLPQKTENSFVRQLNALDLEPHQNHSFDVWKHWLSRKNTHPELYDVATILLAVPSNQVSVERAFSALGLVLSDKRTKLSDDMLENILLIKLNKQLFDKILPGLYNWMDEDFQDLP
ncbi:uncharacterized protein LOC135711083 [Ochlerotatus camptorhynchus]|uniref:uncharacterized protein LOC135711083 n=1 Tax=Ochlerotatus camptorhynchus TaxID=644619 RepID=UPI0031D61C3A